MFVLHQNRVSHGASGKNAVREDLLANFLDIVIWGHEHECLPDPAVRRVARLLPWKRLRCMPFWPTHMRSNSSATVAH